MGRSASGIRAEMAGASSSWWTRRPWTGASPYGNAAAREGRFDGSRVHSGRTLDAAEGTDGPRSAAMSLAPLRRIVLVPHRIVAEVGNRFGERRKQCRSLSL